MYSKQVVKHVDTYCTVFKLLSTYYINRVGNSLFGFSSESLVYCERKSNSLVKNTELLVCKEQQEQIALDWITSESRANHSRRPFFIEQQERFPHCGSFLKQYCRSGSRRTGSRRTWSRRTWRRRTGSRRTGRRKTGSRRTGKRRTQSRKTWNRRTYRAVGHGKGARELENMKTQGARWYWGNTNKRKRKGGQKTKGQGTRTGQNFLDTIHLIELFHILSKIWIIDKKNCSKNSDRNFKFLCNLTKFWWYKIDSAYQGRNS